MSDPIAWVVLDKDGKRLGPLLMQRVHGSLIRTYNRLHADRAPFRQVALADIEQVREDAIDDYFSALSEIANRKDIGANGPNKPRRRRSLHAITLTMAEILQARAKLQRAEQPEEPGR